MLENVITKKWKMAILLFMFSALHIQYLGSFEKMSDEKSLMVE